MIQNFKGLILRKRPFTENDGIVSLLTEDGFRHDAIVKGLHANTSKRRSHLEVMNWVQGTLYQSKSNMYLQDVRCESSFPTLKNDWDKLMAGQLLLEITEKSLMENHAHPEIYELLLNTFSQLNSENCAKATLSTALTKLAQELGILPSFKQCSLCHHKIETDEAFWHSEAGTLSCQSCAPTHAKHLPLRYRKALEFFRSHSFKESLQVQLSPQDQSSLEYFLPELFTTHLHYPLKSLSWMGSE